VWVAVVSIFPELFGALTAHGVVARAVAAGILELAFENPRDHAEDRHHTVDDRPYGGGPGMVMKVAPLIAAIAAAKAAAPHDPRVVYLSPQGRVLDQHRVESLAREDALVFIAGRYEGIDERVLRACVDEEISIGDFVLTGGELPAMVVLDAVARYLPGTLGNADSVAAESHTDGLLDWPHYTRPEVVLGESVPATLLGGDHAAIARYRRTMALAKTYERRPDLLTGRPLDAEDRALLGGYLAARPVGQAGVPLGLGQGDARTRHETLHKLAESDKRSETDA
jgi:tRNA (guanine37-N1)-methyltransferase